MSNDASQSGEHVAVNQIPVPPEAHAFTADSPAVPPDPVLPHPGMPPLHPAPTPVAPPLGQVATPTDDPYGPLYARILTLLTAGQAQILRIEVVAVDANQRGGVVQLVGATAEDVRYAGHLLVHEQDAELWTWLGDGPLVEEQLRFARLHCQHLVVSA